DTFVFDTALNPGSNVDRIADFSVVDDTIWLDNAVFSALGAPGALDAAAFHVGTAAHDADDRIIYDTDSGVLSYDTDGSGQGAAVQFAQLSAHLNLSAADFMVT
uniref:hypothetical protein n=1 Tax=Acidovorax sp. ST3 TaxID=2219062 RepID=UPI00193E7DC2